jgi:hypothetical protein
MIRQTFVFFALAWLAGCSGRDAVRDAGDSARSLVRVDLSYTRVAGQVEPRFDAQAHFVRYRAFDPAGVPTLLGFADFDAIALDTCKVADGIADLDEALSADVTARGVAAEVSLLDAGRLELRGPVDRAMLRPHHYPELIPFVSGVVYGGDDVNPLALGLGQSYLVVGEGGEEVPPFVASVNAPRAFPTLTVEPLRRAGGAASDMEVRWADAGDAEPLLLEAKWASRLGAHAVRCRVRDDGEFAIPHDAFDGLPAVSAPTSATVAATRVARAPLVAAGVGRGELTVELRDVAPLQVAQ